MAQRAHRRDIAEVSDQVMRAHAPVPPTAAEILDDLEKATRRRTENTKARPADIIGVDRDGQVFGTPGALASYAACLAEEDAEAEQPNPDATT